MHKDILEAVFELPERSKCEDYHELESQHRSEPDFSSEAFLDSPHRLFEYAVVRPIHIS